MTYRSIVICLDHEDQVAPLVEMAEKITTDADSIAVLTALHVETGTKLHQSAVPYIPQELLNQLVDESKKRVAILKKTFTELTAQSKNKTHWMCLQGQYAGDVKPYVERALVSDLVITEQPASPSSGLDLQRELLRQSGTPLIMVPKDATGLQLTRHVSVAWNGSMESARAVRDAMPLLLNAQRVNIVCIGKNHDDKLIHAADETELVGWLMAHDIEATTVHLEESRLDVGRKLLSYAKNNDVDMLVMGGFGHSRLYDLVVGAATGEVIRSAEIPIFLSH